jgi:hypothetical protein
LSDRVNERKTDWEKQNKVYTVEKGREKKREKKKAVKS